MTAFEPAPPDERALVRGLVDGSEEALAAIYDRTVPVLYPLALRIVHTRERACCVIEDLFQEIWGDRAAWSGAFAIPMTRLIARCRDLALAQVGHDPRRPMTDRPEEPSSAVGGDPSRREAGSAPSRRPMTDPLYEDISSRDLGPFVSRTTALQALASLPRPDRLALEEAYFRGTNAQEIAALLGISTTDAAEMLRRALLRFRERVEPSDLLEEPEYEDEARDAAASARAAS